MIGAEARAKNIQHPAGGRRQPDPLIRGTGAISEYLGETAARRRDGGQSISGACRQLIVSPTIKHFALNARKPAAPCWTPRIGKAALREKRPAGVQIATEISDPASVMCAYNKVNSNYACENDWLLNTVLKRDWGYKGWVMSDWGRGPFDGEGGDPPGWIGIGPGTGRTIPLASPSPTQCRQAIFPPPAGRHGGAHPLRRHRQRPDGRSGARKRSRSIMPPMPPSLAHGGRHRAVEERRRAVAAGQSARRLVTIGSHAGRRCCRAAVRHRCDRSAARRWKSLTKGAAASFARMTWRFLPLRAHPRARAAGDRRDLYRRNGDPKGRSTGRRDAGHCHRLWLAMADQGAEIRKTLRLPTIRNALIDAVASANRPHHRGVGNRRPSGHAVDRQRCPRWCRPGIREQRRGERLRRSCSTMWPLRVGCRSPFTSAPIRA